MQPLMITASCGNTRPEGPDEPAETIAAIADSVYECYRAGACIAQVRVPLTIDRESGRPLTDMRTWAELLTTIRQRCPILIHAGVAAMPVDARIELLRELRPPFASFLLNHHDIVVRGHDLNSLRTRADGLRLLRGHLETGVRADFEIFHSGGVWNLQYLCDRLAVPRPLSLTLFFGWAGGEWSPPTVEELLTRIAMLPDDAVYTITATGREQLALYAVAIARGGHVRVGLGDDDYFQDGIPAENNAQLVSRVVRLAKEFNREVATPESAAELLGLHRSQA